MISGNKNHYQNLGLSVKATPDEIKKAYRRLAKIYHPDHNPKRKSAEEKFKLLQVAYDTLSDPEKREHYDQQFSEVHPLTTDSNETLARRVWSRLEPHILPFVIGAIIGALVGFKGVAEAYTPEHDSTARAIVFIGGGAVIGGVVASIYFSRKGYR